MTEQWLSEYMARRPKAPPLVAGPELQAQAAILRAKGQGPLPSKYSKYRSKLVMADGKRFGSRKEYQRYLVLDAREKAGEIEGLRCQVKFALYDPGDHCRGEFVGTYTADFVYKENGALVVEDVKSRFTARLREWPRTKKLFRMCHGFEITEVGG